MSSQTSDLRYPIGDFEPPGTITPDLRLFALETLADLPSQLHNAVHGLDHAQLNTPYREGGWTVRQLIHHLADSHMNASIRIRLALTEDTPTIKLYNEAAWADLHDAAAAPIEWSLDLIENLHARWVMLLQSLDEAAWSRTFINPERGPMSVELATLLYAWHSRHHTAHIVHLRRREDW